MTMVLKKNELQKDTFSFHLKQNLNLNLFWWDKIINGH